MTHQKHRTRIRGYLLALASATAYAVQGLLFTAINQKYALSPETMVFFRMGLALLALLMALLIFRRDWLRISRHDLPLFILLGVLGMAAFYLVYARAVILAGVSVSEVLLFTGPVWVTLYAWRFLGEGFDRYKKLALMGILVGAALVAQVSDLGQLGLNLNRGAGIALGLAAGLLYGLYSILNKYAVQRYSPWTVLLFGTAIGWPLLGLVQNPHEIWRALTTPGALPWLLALALGPSLGAGLLYVASLSYLPASIASIIAAWEPVVASLLAYLLLGERLTGGQILGAAAIVGSILLLAARNSEKDQPPAGDSLQKPT